MGPIHGLHELYRAHARRNRRRAYDNHLLRRLHDQPGGSDNRRLYLLEVQVSIRL